MAKQYEISETGLVKIFPLEILISKEFFLHVPEPLNAIKSLIDDHVAMQAKHFGRDISELGDETLTNAAHALEAIKKN